MTSEDSAREAIREKLKDVWHENQAIVTRRVEILREAALAAGEGRLVSAQREEARATAHKLAGSLGMFGLSEASACASAIETSLEQLDFGEQCNIGGLVDSLEKAIGRTL